MKWSASIAAAMLILTCALATPAEAQGSFPQLVCAKCRNPYSHPRDYRNFAYNQLFGPDGWMTYDEGDLFQVFSPAGESVFVDMNMDLDVFTLDLGIPIPLPFPIAVQVQIVLIFENGDQRKYMLDPRAHPDGLPVGRNRGGRGGGSGGGARGGANGGGGSEPPQTGTGSDRKCGITRVDGGKGRRTCV